VQIGPLKASYRRGAFKAGLKGGPRWFILAEEPLGDTNVFHCSWFKFRQLSKGKSIASGK